VKPAAGYLPLAHSSPEPVQTPGTCPNTRDRRRLRRQERRPAVGLGQASAESAARFPFPPHGRIPELRGRRPHDSATSSRGRAPQPSRSIRIHRNARREPKRCAAASPFLYRRPDCAAGAEARCGPNNSAMAMKTAPASARRFGIDGPPRGFCYSERITFQLRTSCSPPPALLTTGLPSVKCASSIASAHPAAIAFSRSASKSGRGA
jgi:hypothetical protein